MEGDMDGSEDGSLHPSPPPRLYDRLAQISGYTWDQSTEPFHSSYDNWHVFGIQHASRDDSATSSLHAGIGRTNSSRSSPSLASSVSRPPHSDATNDMSVVRSESGTGFTPVIARISTHTLRLEREYHLCRSFIQTSDPDCCHTVRLIDLIRLPNFQGDGEAVIASIFESPGRNYLRDLLDFGPQWLPSDHFSFQQDDNTKNDNSDGKKQISLTTFLDFAIGASECLELLHHGLRVVHGELRHDAFHFNQATGAVKLINFGSGPRSFEHGLTSTGWLALSREFDIKRKLQFIAPEQTGRMPAEPDSRTDIYSLGVLFWTLLTQEIAFDGENPIDVVQAVLGRRIVPVSSKRMDIPEVVSSIIQKMTQKQIDERYHSTSGLKHDLVEVQRILGDGDGDGEALMNFTIGVKDVSSFFVLPTNILGRDEPRERIIKIIERVARRQQRALDQSVSSMYSTSTSATSDRPDILENGTKSSETSSQAAKDPNKSPTLKPTNGHSQLMQSESPEKPDPLKLAKTAMGTNDSKDSVDTTTTTESQKGGTPAGQSDGQHNSSLSVPRQQRSHGSGRTNRCEVIAIYGSAGLGKSSLIQNTQSDIRRLGYFASAKFEPTRKAPFDPLLRALASLFRQIFSESDVNSAYHNTVRSNIRGYWPSLCSMLDLPENLISTEAQYMRRPAPNLTYQGFNKSIKNDMTDFGSSHSGLSNGLNTGTLLTSDFLRVGANTRSLKFMNIFLDVLRILSANKLICLCLDDLQFADEESLDLISNMISRKLGIVLVVTCREKELLPGNFQMVIDDGSTNVTTVQLLPLSEQDVIDYVGVTLYRPQEYVLPLAIVCLEKTNGNPFYLRQMLAVCHRKGCLWYSWKNSVWEYDLDRVFSEFESESYGQQLNSKFITRRLQDLPPTARSILAWASLLGNSFSFTLVQRLLSGEFDDPEDSQDPGKPNCSPGAEIFTPRPMEHVVEGLQAALQAYVLVPGNDDDQFIFSHDRYIQASASLRECYNTVKMHFIIVQTMMKYSDLDDRSLYARARHVRQAAELIRIRISHRHHFRKLLFQAAQKAIESGARPTALDYYETCLTLLQDEPWKEGADVYYEETLDLYTRAAELYWYQNQYPKAHEILASIFKGARTASDKAPAWIILSRLHAHQGDTSAAFNALNMSLRELDLDFEAKPSWDICDKEYRNLRHRVQNTDFKKIIQKPLNEEPVFMSMGVVMIEALSAAFWSNGLLFFQVAMKMVDMHLASPGTFYQSGAGFAYFTMVATSRFGDMTFSLKTYKASQELLRRFNDPYTLGRGLTLLSLFLGHLFTPIRDNLEMQEEALEYCLVSGDKHTFLFSVAGLALSRLHLGTDMAELESYCSIGPEDFGDWASDLRGGVLLTAVRQVARALRGKTCITSADAVMSDENHDTVSYINYIHSNASNVERPRDFYNSLHIIPLYLFGHYDKAIEIGNQVNQTIHGLWSFRNSRLTLFYLSLSLLAKAKETSSGPERDLLLGKVMEHKDKIVEWQAECDVNYLMWSHLIAAELAEIVGDYHNAIRSYEAAIDHTQLHDFMLEQALAFELQGEFFIRRGARRAARTTIMDAVAMYSSIGATGKVDLLTAKHEWVLKSAATVRTADVGIQTADSIGDIQNTQFRIEENERQEMRNLGKETAGDRTKAWVSPEIDTMPGLRSKDSNDVSGLGLDVLDLQSILEFNQAISSELQIDRLLAKMTQIILESAGAQADFAGVVIEGEGGWGMAASGTPDGINADAMPLLAIQDETQKQVLLYTMRFKEAVFVHNVLNDDRFCNTPSVKSVISLPIIQGQDLLGVLYLEGQPNSFTDRNLGVLQLFCNQVGISIANALLFRRIRQVSASNTSMIESQKRALAKAREAEIKAKLAEAEAVKNVRLKEEAAKAKSMFLANVSHELRTPLNGVIGMSELLKATSLNQEQDGYADSIRVCADTLLTVINDILDFSKLEAGKMKLFSVPLNLKDTIAEVVRALSYANLERGLQTIEDLDLDPHLLVMGDPVRLHQIFMNLLSNSYKFTARGSVTVKARTDYEDDEAIRVTCAVVDTGIGITQEQVSRLFKPFSQADSSTQRSYGGSGLGLSICKALVNVLNGKIWLESQLDIGTTVFFTVTFPKAPKSATANNAEVSAREPDPMATWSSDTDGIAPRSSTAPFVDLSQIPREKLRICIAEDNPINQKIAVSFVTKLGFRPAAYSDGLQAVEALRRKSSEGKPFHLVLMDVQMPVLDGYDATRLIRKDADPAVRSVLIIAMTASAIRGDREKCLQAGMNNYLAKPVRAAVLKSMLEDYLSQPPRPIPSLQETVNGLAKDVLEEAEQDRETSLGSEKLKFSARMSGRNELPFQGEDPQIRDEPQSRLPARFANDLDHSGMPGRPALHRNDEKDSEKTVTHVSQD